MLRPENEDHEIEADTISNAHFNLAGEMKRVSNKRKAPPSTWSISEDNFPAIRGQDGGASAKLKLHCQHLMEVLRTFAAFTTSVRP